MKTFSKNFALITVIFIPCYIFRFSLLGLKTNLFEILVLLSLLVSLLWGDLKKELVKKYLIMVGVMFLPLFVSLFTSHFSLDALGIVKGWFVIPMIFGGIILVNFKKDNISEISFALYLSLMIVAFMAVLQKVGVFSTLFYQRGDVSFNQYLEQGRLFGIFESPNYLAMYLTPMIFLSLPGLSLLKRNYSKTIFLCLYSLPLFSLFESGSRAGLIAFVISSLIFCLAYWLKLKKNNISNIFSLFLPVALILLNSVYFIFSLNYQTSRGGDLIRISIYKYSLQLLKTNWLLGIGLDNFQNKINTLSLGDATFQLNGLQYALHPHNLYLAFWLYLGILGILAFLIMLYIIIRNLFKTMTFASISMISALFAVLVHGFFDTTYFKNDLSTIFWLIIAFSIILSYDKQKTPNN